MSDQKEHHIFRIGKGYQVKAIIDGKQQTKYFSDGKTGGKNEALAQAVQYRDRILKKRNDFSHRHDSYETRFYYPDGIGDSTTGIPGIHLAYQKGKEGNIYPYISTTILIEKKKPINRKRSIEKWGFESALDQIALIRKKWMKKIYPARFDEKRFDALVEKFKTDNKWCK
jgi:hypothetical protein